MEESADPMRAEICMGLEEARGAFAELLGSLSEADLKTKPEGFGWSVGEVAIHVVSSIERTPALIRALRRDQDYLNYPLPIAERIKRLDTWWAARGVTREALARRFEAAYPPVLALVDTIRREEWERGGHAYGEGYWTVEHALWHQREHMEEHVQQIGRLLRRG